jgi:peptidoglycan/LPS O-acetylase OafA/YrhL
MASLLAWPVTQPHAARSRPINETLAGPGRHISALDGIRGLAVLLVLVFHIFQVEPVPQHSLLRLGYAATRFGQTGVDLFFVLSGFLITGILFDTKSSRRYFINFYGRRTLRIFPLYYGVLVLLLVVLPRLVDIRATGVPSIWFWTFSTNFALTTGQDAGVLGHFWSLAIEEQFYLVWPLVVFALGRVALMRVCAASLVMSAAMRLLVESQGMSSFMVTLCRVDTLLLGALLALAARSARGLIDWSGKAGAVGLATLAVALPLCFSMSGSGSIWLQAVKYPLIAVFYSAVLVIGVTASPGSWAGWLLTLGPLRSLGRYSFGIYVYHPPLIHAVAWLFNNVSPAPAMAGPVFALKLAMIFGATFATAWLSWHLYEKRFLTLKRYFEYDRASS